MTDWHEDDGMDRQHQDDIGDELAARHAARQAELRDAYQTICRLATPPSGDEKAYVVVDRQWLGRLALMLAPLIERGEP